MLARSRRGAAGSFSRPVVGVDVPGVEPRSRATGVAWMLGIGRMGAVAGAMTGGVLMSMGLQFGAVFTLLAIPAIIAAFALGALSRRDRASEATQRLMT